MARIGQDTVWARLASLCAGAALASGCSQAVVDAPADAATDSAADAASEDAPEGLTDAANPDTVDPDTANPDAIDPDTVLDAAPDGAPGDAALADGAATDDGSAAADADPDATDAAGFDAISCTPGTTTCQGVKLATCLGDGYSVSPCFPGTACLNGACKPVGANLIIAFDTSGSMSTDVVGKNGQKNCPSGYDKWPVCEYGSKYPNGCTRIGVSKTVFKQALAKLDDQVTHLALLKFPQTVSSGTTCDSGAYSGQDTISGDKDEQGLSSATSWWTSGLGQVLCVPFPKLPGFDSKAAIGKWMDGTESQPGDPELRADGGTPIGKTLFYVGEYIRNFVVIDGKTCTADADCGNVNYQCVAGACKDPARSCRDTVVVLFTDGGESTTNSYFGPWVQAKRLSTGLGCQTSADCVGGATCDAVMQCQKTGSGWTGSTDAIDDKPCASDADCGSGGKCASHQQCRAKPDPTGLPYFCSDGGAPCDPLVSAHCASKDPNKPCKPDTGSPVYCAGYCVRDPRNGLSAVASSAANNVLRSPDGKAFGVKVYIVDIGSTSDTDIINSWRLAMSGGGHLLGVDAGDPAAFLGVLDKAFDWKNKKVCGAE